MSSSQTYVLLDPADGKARDRNYSIAELQELLNRCEVDSTWKAVPAGAAKPVSLGEISGLTTSYDVAIVYSLDDLVDETRWEALQARIAELNENNIGCRRIEVGPSYKALLQSRGFEISDIDEGLLEEIRVDEKEIYLGDAKCVVASASLSCMDNPSVREALKRSCDGQARKGGRIPMLPISLENEGRLTAVARIPEYPEVDYFIDAAERPLPKHAAKQQIERIVRILKGVKKPWGLGLKVALAILALVTITSGAAFIWPRAEPRKYEKTPEQIEKEQQAKERKEREEKETEEQQQRESRLQEGLASFKGPAPLPPFVRMIMTPVAEGGGKEWGNAQAALGKDLRVLIKGKEGAGTLAVLMFEEEAFFCFAEEVLLPTEKQVTPDLVPTVVKLKALADAAPASPPFRFGEIKDQARKAVAGNRQIRKAMEEAIDFKTYDRVLVCGSVPQKLVELRGLSNARPVSLDAAFFQDLESRMAGSPQGEEVRKAGWLSGCLQALTETYKSVRFEWDPEFNKQWMQKMSFDKGAGQ